MRMFFALVLAAALVSPAIAKQRPGEQVADSIHRTSLNLLKLKLNTRLTFQSPPQ
jgi:hypothetical protein